MYFFFQRKKSVIFIHLSRSKLHSVYSHPGEFQNPKKWIQNVDFSVFCNRKNTKAN